MRTTFEALGLSPDLVEALNTAGITHPFPIQSLTIADALGITATHRRSLNAGRVLVSDLDG